MENKFEQLIEYIINDEEDKAKELFHEVVVEKSREIYENLMAEDEVAEEVTEEEMPMGDEEGAEEVVGDEEEEDVEMPFESKEEVAKEEQVDEAVSLKAVKADNADHATNKTSPVPANGGAKEKLADAHPAKTEQENGRPAPKAKELPHGTTEPDPKKV